MQLFTYSIAHSYPKYAIFTYSIVNSYLHYAIIYLQYSTYIHILIMQLFTYSIAHLYPKYAIFTYSIVNSYLHYAIFTYRETVRSYSHHVITRQWKLEVMNHSTWSCDTFVR